MNQFFTEKNREYRDRIKMLNRTKEVAIQKFSPGKKQPQNDLLAYEEPLEIRIGYGAAENRRRESLAVTMRTPGDDFDLVLGFLFTEGIVVGAGEVLSLRFLEDNLVLADLVPSLSIDFQRFKRNFYASSSCGICGKAALDAVETATCFRPLPGKPKLWDTFFYDLPDKLRVAQRTFETTGGLHAAGLFDASGKLVMLREDIGRHNAVDKLLGAAFRSGLGAPLQDHIIMVSGRAGFELVQKASMAGLPILAAVGAPSSLAVELAEEAGMTLVGFLRNERFNVYAHATRIESSTY